MDILIGIQPNCSEVAIVIHADKLNKKQQAFFSRFTQAKGLEFFLSPMQNYILAYDSKEELNKIRESLIELSEWENIKFKEGEQFELIRDEGYYDMKDEGKI